MRPILKKLLLRLRHAEVYHQDRAGSVWMASTKP